MIGNDMAISCLPSDRYLFFDRPCQSKISPELSEAG
jgi:hypothetical protein